MKASYLCFPRPLFREADEGADEQGVSRPSGEEIYEALEDQSARYARKTKHKEVMRSWLSFSLLLLLGSGSGVVVAAGGSELNLVHLGISASDVLRDRRRKQGLDLWKSQVVAAPPLWLKLTRRRISLNSQSG